MGWAAWFYSVLFFKPRVAIFHSVSLSNHPVAISFFRLDTIWGFFSRYDTILGPQKRPSFLRNFRRIFRNFGEFSEFSENFLNFRNFRRIFGFLENFWNFRRIFGGKHKINQYRDTRYWRCDTIYSSIYWKVRYIGIRYDNLSPDDNPALGAPSPLPGSVRRRGATW